MKLKIKRFPFTWVQAVTLMLLFIGGMNVANMYYYFCFPAALLFFVFNRRVILDWNVVILLMFSLAWLLCSPDLEYFSITTILKPFLYPLVYMVGRSFFVAGKTGERMAVDRIPLSTVIIILSTGPFLHYLLNYLTGFGSTSRNTVDIWTGTVLSATGQAALACMMIGVSMSTLFMPKQPILKVGAALTLVLMFMYNLVLAGRTLLLIMAIVALVCSVYSFAEQTSMSKRFKIISMVLGILLGAYALYAYNVFGIKDFVESSNIYLRFINKTTEDFFSGGRLQLKMLHLEHFWDGIWGGCKIRRAGIGYAHDLLLDAYDEAGIFALLALVLFVVRSAWTLLCVIREKRIDFSIRLTLIAVYITFYLEFSVEPILQGIPWFFVFFCFIHGLTEYVYVNMRRLSAKADTESSPSTQS